MTTIGYNRKQLEGHTAFVPDRFPPEGGFVISNELALKHTHAIHLIGKLDGITRLLPDKDYFLEMFIRKDASSSSQIEGTKATMMDAVDAANKERTAGLPDDVDDILHYIDALNYGLKRATEMPLSLRLIEELHKKLMTSARSTQAAFPGEFRRSQNWIGGTSPSNARFVPPPAHDMKIALGDLEKFLHVDDARPLIKAGLMHAQFETIHPFADGNGRTGRMLVTMYLWHLKLLEIPVLYLSSYFKKHQNVYYERLDGYHANPGKLDEWLDFFLDGVITTSESAIETCQRITELREQDMRKAQQLGKTAAQVTVDVLRNLYRLPSVGVADIADWTGYTRQGAYNVIERMVKLNILYPTKEPASYGQKYVYKEYVTLFESF